MKKILTIITAALLSSTLNAQSPVTTGNVIIDPYIGFPQSNATRSEPTGAMNYKLNINSRKEALIKLLDVIIKHENERARPLFARIRA